MGNETMRGQFLLTCMTHNITLMECDGPYDSVKKTAKSIIDVHEKAMDSECTIILTDFHNHKSEFLAMEHYYKPPPPWRGPFNER